MWNDTLTLNRLSAALLVLALVLLAYGAARWRAAQPRFAIRTVLVQAAGERALEHVSAERVAQFCLPRINGTFFTTDLAQAKNAFEALPRSGAPACAGSGRTGWWCGWKNIRRWRAGTTTAAIVL